MEPTSQPVEVLFDQEKSTIHNVSTSTPKGHESEAGVISDTEVANSLKHRLTARHLSMIALGGALGTGLIIGTGAGLQRAGPGAILITYSLIGFVVFLVLGALGEVATWMPLASGFTGYASRYVDPSIGFALGYW